MSAECCIHRTRPKFPFLLRGYVSCDWCDWSEMRGTNGLIFDTLLISGESRRGVARHVMPCVALTFSTEYKLPSS